MDNITSVSLREQRISPKKARLVLSSIRGNIAPDALVALDLQDKKGSFLVKKLLKNALDAAHAKDFKDEELFISEAICQEGRKLRRNRIKARGRSVSFHRRMAHLKISLSKIENMPSSHKKMKKEEKKTAKKAKS